MALSGAVSRVTPISSPVSCLPEAETARWRAKGAACLHKLGTCVNLWVLSIHELPQSLSQHCKTGQRLMACCCRALQSDAQETYIASTTQRRLSRTDLASILKLPLGTDQQP